MKDFLYYQNENNYHSILALREAFFLHLQIENMETLKAYLIRNNANKDTIDSLKKEYKKDYQTKKHQEFRERNKSVKLFFDKSKEYPYIERQAKKHGLKISSFVKDCVFAYLKKQYISPNEDKLERCIQEIAQIRTAIDRIGTNINQIAKHTNQQKFLGNDYEKQIYKSIFDLDKLNIFFELEDRINAACREPRDLISFLKSKFEEDKNIVFEVEKLINKYKK